MTILILHFLVQENQTNLMLPTQQNLVFILGCQHCFTKNLFR